MHSFFQTFLQVALCSAFMRIVTTCPPYIWRPESLLHMLSFSEPCLALIECFQVAISVLGPDRVGDGANNYISAKVDPSVSVNKRIERLKVGGKRPGEDINTSSVKRQKLVGEAVLSYVFTCETEEGYADQLSKALFSFVELLEPRGVKAKSLTQEISLTALSMLCFVFTRYPWTNLSLCIFKKIRVWIPWICEQVGSMPLLLFSSPRLHGKLLLVLCSLYVIGVVGLFSSLIC